MSKNKNNENNTWNHVEAHLMYPEETYSYHMGAPQGIAITCTSTLCDPAAVKQYGHFTTPLLLCQTVWWLYSCAQMKTCNKYIP